MKEVKAFIFRLWGFRFQAPSSEWLGFDMKQLVRSSALVSQASILRKVEDVVTDLCSPLHHESHDKLPQEGLIHRSRPQGPKP